MSQRRLPVTYGLRALLIAFTLLALALGWLADRHHRRQAAIATIRSAGGQVQSEYEERRLLNMFLSPSANGVQRPPVVRTWSERILGDRLKRVTLLDQPLSARLLAAIASLSELRELNLTGTGVRDDQVATLQSLRQLESLSLNGCQISDRATKVLAAFPELKSLELQETDLTDDAIPHLTQLQNLESLRLSGTGLTDRGIGQLRALTNLKDVQFGNTERQRMLITEDCEEELRRHLPQCSINGWTLAERAANPPEMAPH